MKFWLAVAGLTATNAFGGGHHDPNDIIYRQGNEREPVRCEFYQVPEPECPAARATAVASGCIDEIERQILEDKKLVPACVVRGSGFLFAGSCMCGCFEPNSLIAVFNTRELQSGFAKAGEIPFKTDHLQLLTLKEGATLDSLQYQSLPVKMSTRGKEHAPLVVLHLGNGRKLKITEKHPVLLGTGEMVKAVELKAGEQLVAADGSAVTLKEVTREEFKGEVVNFSTTADAKESHILVAEGILVGDLAWQNELAYELEAVRVRSE